PVPLSFFFYCSRAHPDLHSFPTRRSSDLRVTDQFSGFAKATPEMLERERELARRVDLVVYTAKSLEPHVKSLKPRRMAHVPNGVDRKSTRLNSSHRTISYAVFCLKKKKKD